MGVGAVYQSAVSDHHHPHSSPTPPLQRRLAKSFSVAPSQTKGSYHIFHIFKSLRVHFIALTLSPLNHSASHAIEIIFHQLIFIFMVFANFLRLFFYFIRT